MRTLHLFALLLLLAAAAAQLPGSSDPDTEGDAFAPAAPSAGVGDEDPFVSPSAEAEPDDPFTPPAPTPSGSGPPAEPSPAPSTSAVPLPLTTPAPSPSASAPATPPPAPTSPAPTQSTPPPAATATPAFAIDVGPDERGFEAACFTDPHLRTFDGLSFDCQAAGEFVAAASASRAYAVHVRFSGPTTRGTVTTGVAMSSSAASKIELSIAPASASTAGGNATDIGGCAVAAFIDGAPVDPTAAASSAFFAVEPPRARIRLPNGVSATFRVAPSATFGCYFESLALFLPAAEAAADTRGLLGTPNRNASDDWVRAASGAVVAPPASSAEALFRRAYEYCTAQWCVRDAGASLFMYSSPGGFAAANQCDRPYPAAGGPDLAAAPPAVRRICQDDAACLVDGLVAGADAARAALRVQAEVDTRLAARAPFRFSPAVIPTGAPTTVSITLDMSDLPTAALAGVESFALYRDAAAPGLASSGDNRLADLLDNGLVAAADARAGDRVFSGVLALQSARAGEVFRFRAVPQFAGGRDAGSPLVRTALTGVRSVAASNGTGGATVGQGSGRTVSVASLGGLELAVIYSWPLDQNDLDTATTFLGQTVGFGCGSSETRYVAWDGDVTASGGTEAATVRLGQALADGEWSGSTKVRFSSGWFSSGTGPASIRMLLRNAVSKVPVAGTTMTTATVPGTQSGCADKVVAELDVTVGARVQLSLRNV